MNEDTIMLFSASGRKISLDSGKLLGYSQGITPSEGVKVKHFPVASENFTRNQPSLGNDAK